MFLNLVTVSDWLLCHINGNYPPSNLHLKRQFQTVTGDRIRAAYVMELRTCFLLTWIVSVKSGQRLAGFQFRTENPIGKKECLVLCYQHTDCLSVNFSKNRLLCELNYQTETNDTQVTDDLEDFIYIPRDSISQVRQYHTVLLCLKVW